MENQKCIKCGTLMNLREKEGSKFWGCPNWATKKCKTVPYFEGKRIDSGFKRVEPKQEDKLSVAIEMMAKLDTLILAARAILQETNPDAYNEVFKD